MNRRWQTRARRAIAMLVLAIPAAASGLERSVVDGPLASRDYWLFESAQHADGGSLQMEFDGLESATGSIDAYRNQPGVDRWRRPAIGLARLTQVLLLPQF
jgi:hypothetical protein